MGIWSESELFSTELVDFAAKGESEKMFPESDTEETFLSFQI